MSTLRIGELLARLARLQALRDQVDAQLTATRNAIDMYGDHPLEHGPLRTEYTLPEMRAAHSLHVRGITSPWVDDGERAYQRTNKAERRAAS